MAAEESELITLRRELASAEEKERGRLSRDLHDQLGQHLTAITLGLQEIARLIPADSAATERVASLLQLTTLLTRDTRFLAVQLRPPELDDVGLESAMASYIEQWSHHYGIVAEFQETGAPDGQRADISATTVYRVLQEALTNVAKHARASRVSVLLEQVDGELRLIVEDDGAGFDVEQTVRTAVAEHRLGLAGMRERVSLARGVLTIESRDAGGTSVFVRLPADGESRLGTDSSSR